MGSRTLFFLAGVFLIVAPLSVATELDAAGPAKYLRLGTTGLIVVAGVLQGGLLRIGGATTSILPFVAFWAVSPLWSKSPLWGLFFKGMFCLTFLGGVLVATHCRTLKPLQSGIRFLGMVALVAALVAFAEYLRNPGGSVRLGRLAVGGLNANVVAEVAVCLAILCTHLALNDARRATRMVSAAGVCLLLLLVLLTGSRGGAAMGLVGCGVLLLPKARKPGILLLGVGAVVAVSLLGWELLGISDDNRLLSELGKDTRSSVWQFGFRRFSQSPLIGHGWLTQSGTAWATLQSAYIQVLVETGLLGAVLLLVFLLGIGPRWLQARRWTRINRELGPNWILSGACIAASLFHGLMESSMVLGTSLTPFLLGFGIGMLDQVPRLSRMGSSRAAADSRFASPRLPRPQSTMPAAGRPGST